MSRHRITSAGFARLGIVVGLIVATLTAGCDPFPRDHADTYRDVKRSGVMHVGVAHAPPFVLLEGDDVRGIEPSLLEAFARRLEVEIEWHPMGAAELAEALKHHEIELAAAGITRDSPWRHAIGTSRPYVTWESNDYVLAVPPGENQWVTELDTFLDGRTDQVRRALQTEDPGRIDATGR